MSVKHSLESFALEYNNMLKRIFASGWFILPAEYLRAGYRDIVIALVPHELLR